MGRPKDKRTWQEKFWTFVNKAGEDDCWEWTGTLFSQGYGRFYHLSTKESKAHRLSYILHNNFIPEGLLICHRCNNKICVNPKHLYAGTNNDNMLDLVEAGTLKGENNPASKLTEVQVVEIRKKYAKNYGNTYQLAKLYGVSQLLVSKIIRGVAWTHVHGPIKGVDYEKQT